MVEYDPRFVFGVFLASLSNNVKLQKSSLSFMTKDSAVPLG